MRTRQSQTMPELKGHLPTHPTQTLTSEPLALLQWTATSRGSRNRTCLEVLCGSSPWHPHFCRLSLRIEGGHFLSPS